MVSKVARQTMTKKGSQVEIGRNWQPSGFRALIVMDWDDFVVPAGLRPAMAFEADNGLKRRSGKKWQTMTYKGSQEDNDR